MIEVNLLSEEKQHRVSRQRLDPTKPLLFVAFIVIFAAVALIDLYLHSKATAIKSEIKQIKADMNTPKFVESLKQANTLQFELDQLNRKAVIFDDLVTNRIHWSKKLAALRDSLPKDIWVEKINLENPKNPKITFQTLRIEAASVHTGRAFAREAETMDSIRNSDEFMEGFDGDPLSVKGVVEPWDKSDLEGVGGRKVWRFSFKLQRSLPESEIAKK